MTYPVYPSTLPNPQQQSANYAPYANNILVTNMTAGAPKTRRMFTYVPETFTCQLYLDANQFSTLDTFITVTLKDVLPFQWTDWRTNTSKNYAFISKPTYASDQNGVGYTVATLSLITVS